MNKPASKPPKLSTKHPYAAIDHRVIDSAAYADLSHSGCRLMVILCRQLTKDNNGNLQATFAYCQPRGIASEHTLRAAIADLIAHGFIYRTRSHGANKAWARYAVTWLSVTKKDGLFLAGFVSCAWRNWIPETDTEKKSSLPKLQDQSGRKCSFTIEKPAETAGKLPAETADYELITNSSIVVSCNAGSIPGTAQLQPDDCQDDYHRTHDDEVPAECWDGGSYHQPVTKPRITGDALDVTRKQIAALQAKVAA